MINKWISQGYSIIQFQGFYAVIKAFVNSAIKGCFSHSLWGICVTQNLIQLCSMSDHDKQMFTKGYIIIQFLKVFYAVIKGTCQLGDERVFITRTE
jgi:hypothetical protein